MTGLDRLHEIAEDVGRTVWLRDLGAALRDIAYGIEGGTRDLSGYESDVLAWVEENGGLDAVKAQRSDCIPRAAYERKKAGWLTHIRECETALAKRNLRIRELEKELEGTLRRTAELECTCVELKARRTKLADENDTLRNELADIRGRLMPEGMEWLLEVWPKWSNGEYCKFGDWWVSDNYGVSKPKRFRRLSIYTPEQLDEWGQGDGESYDYEWDFLRPADPKYRPDKLEPPASKVLAADGEPLEVGQTVYVIANGKTYHVTEVDAVSKLFRSLEQVDSSYWLDPMCFTHQRPDSWERIEEDADALAEAEINGEGSYNAANDYCTRHGLKDGTVWVLVAQDLVRRCRALAERGE